jgi:hypothetical protein
MNNISKEEYLRLLEELANEEDYGEDQEDTSVPEDSWIWGESPNKEKIKKLQYQSVIDVTKFKKDKIQDALYKTSTIQCHEFTIKIAAYHGRPEKVTSNNDLSMDIVVWEKRYKTPSGNPCNMDFKKDFFKDNRFSNRPWLTYFSANGSADDIPVKTVVEIIRWMQGIKRMTAFL